jgi:exodeoxyribonuclease VII large subunit
VVSPPLPDFGVLQLNSRIRDLLVAAFPYPAWLRGEISGKPRMHARGHVYFQVVERSPLDGSVLASIDCALFAGSRAAVTRDFARAGRVFDLGEGENVRILGRVDLWPPSGRFQFIVESIDPAFQGGDQTLLLKRLVDDLRAKGALDRNAKLAMPALPLRVGLVTASGSAALEDFLTTLRESGFPFEVWIAASPMQGQATAQGVVKAMRMLARLGTLDAVVLTRGGGSSADLAGFNSEAIALAISAAPWPVISGIGHEVDFTLPDFAAHTRAKTPTHAAQILVDAVSDFSSDVAALSRMLAVIAVPRITAERRHLEAQASRLGSGLGSASGRWTRHLDRHLAWVRSSFERRISGLSASLDAPLRKLAPGYCLRSASLAQIELQRMRRMLRPSAERTLATASNVLGMTESVLSANDPSRMFSRGWSIVTTEDGAILRSVEDTSPGKILKVRVSDGSVTARTEEIQG